MARALPLQGRGRRFESVNAHHRIPQRPKGFWLLLWEVDDLWLVGSRQVVGTRRFGGCIEGVGDVAVEEASDYLYERDIVAYPYTTELPVVVLGAKYRWARGAGLL